MTLLCVEWLLKKSTHSIDFSLNRVFLKDYQFYVGRPGFDARRRWLESLLLTKANSPLPVNDNSYINELVTRTLNFSHDAMMKLVVIFYLKNV